MASPPVGLWSKRSQRRLGPAPFASFEDLSDEVDSPPEARLPGIREAPDAALHTPSTPRIDISRASSSSHHGSSNSSPERELFAGEVSGAKLGLGFKEEGAADLRSSTEELDFHEEPGTVEEQEAKRKKERLLKKQQATVFKYELEAQSEKERKDSACSEMGLLSISGRTSRLSSIGSAASGGSVASALSGASHLSVMSGASSTRSPSPHKMLLETSFCGSKPILTQSIEMESPPTSNKHEAESLEKTDPTVAVIGGDDIINVTNRHRRASPKRESRRSRRDDDKRILADREKAPSPMLPISAVVTPSERELLAARNEALMEEVRRQLQEKRGELQKEREERSEREPQKPVTLNLSQTGKSAKHVQSFTQLVQRESSTSRIHSDARPITPKVSDSGTTPRSITGTPSASPKPSRHAKLKKSADDTAGSRTPSPSSTSRKSSFTSIFKRSEATPSFISPESPTVPQSKRKSGGFTTILKEASEGLRERSRSRSKSRERSSSGGMTIASDAAKVDAKGKKDSKNKSVFSSLFKKKDRKKGTKNQDDALSPVDLSSPEPKLEPMGNVEFTFNHDSRKEPDVIEIRLRDTPIEERDDWVPASEFLEPEDRKENIQEMQLPSESKMLPTLSHEPRVLGIDQSERTTVIIEKVQDVIEVVPLKEEPQKLPKKEMTSSKRENIHRKAEKHSVPKQEITLPPKKEKEAIEHPASAKISPAMTEHLPLSEEPNAIDSAFTAEEAEHHSSESERDSEIEYIRAKAAAAAAKKLEEEGEEDDHERKGLVLQQDSFEDELPYVPTTLPQERSVAVPILPVKQRIAEVKTCPIERPRSTTPINPSLLEEYVHSGTAEEVTTREQAVEKMRICLPREDSITSRVKSPRRTTSSAKSWFEFAEQGIQSPREYRKPSLKSSSPSSPPPPPLPPRAQQTPPPQTPPPKPTSWINFEEIPEKRKPPKRIQTIPSRGNIEVPENVRLSSDSDLKKQPIVYSYVNPEDCKCECHETGTAKQSVSADKCSGHSEHKGESTEHELPGSKLEVEPAADRHSFMSDSSYEYQNSYNLDGEYSDGLKPMKPFGMDLDVTSNRSSIISQDEPQSPEMASPHGNEVQQ